LTSTLAVYLEIKAEMVYGNGVLAGVVLHDAGEEGLREKEAGYPENDRLPVVMPVLQHIPHQYTVHNIKCSLTL